MPDAGEAGPAPSEPEHGAPGMGRATPTPAVGPESGLSERSPDRPGRPGPGKALLVVLGVLVLAAGGFAVVAKRHHDRQNQPIRVSGIPATVSTPLATLMLLSPLPAKPAPGFTLVDQYGHEGSLSDFRGRAVVLEFMDSHCTDICPIVSQEFVNAYHDLGNAASHAVFIAINVNTYHAAVSDVAAFSQEHQLDTIPNWHFFTGSTAVLQAVWNSYGVVVQAPSPSADIVHSSFIFFIDAKGNERYLADPTDDHTASGAAFLTAGALSSWGRGIALVSRSISQ